MLPRDLVSKLALLVRALSVGVSPRSLVAQVANRAGQGGPWCRAWALSVWSVRRTRLAGSGAQGSRKWRHEAT